MKKFNKTFVGVMTLLGGIAQTYAGAGDETVVPQSPKISPVARLMSDELHPPQVEKNNWTDNEQSANNYYDFQTVNERPAIVAGYSKNNPFKIPVRKKILEISKAKSHNLKELGECIKKDKIDKLRMAEPGISVFKKEMKKNHIVKEVSIESGSHMKLEKDAVIRGNTFHIAKDALCGGNGCIAGNVQNKGSVYVGKSYDKVFRPADGILKKEALTQTEKTKNCLLIQGDYEGKTGSKLYLNTKLGDDLSKTDSLIIMGHVAGETELVINNVSGVGARTASGIPIITTLSANAGSVFKLSQNLVVNGYQYSLLPDNNNLLLVSRPISVLGDDAFNNSVDWSFDEPSDFTDSEFQHVLLPRKDPGVTPMPSSQEIDDIIDGINKLDASAEFASLFMDDPGSADSLTNAELNNMRQRLAQIKDDNTPYTNIIPDASVTATEPKSSATEDSDHSVLGDGGRPPIPDLVSADFSGGPSSVSGDVMVLANDDEGGSGGAIRNPDLQDNSGSSGGAEDLSDTSSLFDEERDEENEALNDIGHLFEERPEDGEALEDGDEDRGDPNPWPVIPSADHSPAPAPIELRPEAGIYAANMATANTLFATRVHDRIGAPMFPSAFDDADGAGYHPSLWLRIAGGQNSARMLDGALSTRTNTQKVQLGGEMFSGSHNGIDGLHAGIMFGAGKSRSHSHVANGQSVKGGLEGYAAGIYGTWYTNDGSHEGLYLDGWLNYNWFGNHVNTGPSDKKSAETETYRSHGFVGAIEAGYTLKLFTGTAFDAYLQPQMQVTWMGVKAQDHMDRNGGRVIMLGNDNIQTRLGSRLYLQGYASVDEGKQRMFRPYMEMNWIHNTKDFGVRVDQTAYAQQGGKDIGEIKIGNEGQLNEHLALWGSVGQQVGGKGYHDTVGTLGVKVNF
ncbi:autotransporter outer membrane beta-barrel domain-containing protein [Acerihabitans arboris]|uniref:Autotransporter outer membrane beta-barrel domain-containing protein n=1 Tax=Acerihabitans arboris TaxID=2691583 RepID=A0A845SKP3_9GAMM|nr:autotransporter outer membrane beta-barrel domain-containing protein [Acerihabitans arboris]NDL63148.1 autotransporter outer membrane beta-barrel domain-containing protein [Acerihabitans arboris]